MSTSIWGQGYSVRRTSLCAEGCRDGVRWWSTGFGAIHISYNYEIDCKSVYRTILFVWTSNAACRSQSSDNTKKDYKCIYRIITLSCLKMIWERSFCIASNATCRSQSNATHWSQSSNESNAESKGDCGLLQSESLFAAALNQRGTYFRTLSHKTCVNANPPTGPNDA